MNKDEKARIIELREEGLSYTEIAKIMDISKNTIKSFCRRNGITETKKDKGDLGVCERQAMSASVDIAIRHFFPMEIRIENTAVINVISMTDLEVRRMHVTNSIPSSIDVSARKMTKEAMRKDFEYEIAQKLTQSLLEQGLIFTEEYNKIKVLNIEKFSPFYKDLMDI